MKVGVIGGGAVGLTAAHDLAARGADVTLFEKGEIPNEGESTPRAAGVLYDAFAAPEDARVGGRAIERFREFSGTGGFEFEETPYIWFARTGDEKRVAAIREQVPRMREQGRNVAFIHASELKERFPALNVEDVGVAAIARNTGCTDPGSYAQMMAAEAEEAGAEIRTNTPVRIRLGDEKSDDRPKIIPDDDSVESFDAIIVAAGSHTKRVFAEAGIPVALKPYRVQALTCEFDADTPMLYDATESYYLRPHPEGLLAGDGTEEVESDPTDWKHEADDAFVAAMEDRLSDRLDFDAGDNPTIERAWAGLCMATPDYDPLLGELRSNCYIAAGWQGHGFMRSPALGEAIAEDVLGEGEIQEFDPTRFAGDEEFEIVEGMAVE